MSASRVLLDPTGERESPSRERAPRPESLDGRTIGLLDISKPRGDVFLNRLEQQLAGRGLHVQRFTKPTFSKQSLRFASVTTSTPTEFCWPVFPSAALVRGKQACTTPTCFAAWRSTPASSEIA